MKVARHGRTSAATDAKSGLPARLLKHSGPSAGLASSGGYIFPAVGPTGRFCSGVIGHARICAAARRKQHTDAATARPGAGRTGYRAPEQAGRRPVAGRGHIRLVGPWDRGPFRRVGTLKRHCRFTDPGDRPGTGRPSRTSGVPANLRKGLLRGRLARLETLHVSADHERGFGLQVQACQCDEVGVCPIQHDRHCGVSGSAVDV